MKNVSVLFIFLAILSITSATASPVVFEKTELGDYMGINFLLIDLMEDAGGEAPRWNALQETSTATRFTTEDQQTEQTDKYNKTEHVKINISVDGLTKVDSEMPFSDKADRETQSNDTETNYTHKNNKSITRISLPDEVWEDIEVFIPAFDKGDKSDSETQSGDNDDNEDDNDIDAIDTEENLT